MFRCCQDEDVESFLRTKAFDYDEKDICRVYLILDEEQFDNNIIDIVAYFTLSQRSLIFTDSVSKRTIKTITKFKNRKSSEFILIGQLGKYKKMSEDGSIYSVSISLNDILDYIMEVIASIEQYIPCKALLIECSEEVHKKGIYSNCKYPFTLLQYETPFYQYFKIL